MNSSNNNTEPTGVAGPGVAESPSNVAYPEAARVEQAEQVPPAGQGSLHQSTYPLQPPYGQPQTQYPQYPQYPQTQYGQPQAQYPPEYVIQPVQPRPEVRPQGNRALMTVLAILGVLAVLGITLAVIFAFWVANIVGQVTNPQVGELRTETQTVELGSANSAVVNVSMGVGELDIAGGASDLMNSTFTYNVEAWKPVVSYNVKGDEGTLLVSQPNQRGLSMDANIRYSWDLRFKNDVPMTMKVDMGVGDGDLRFGGLNLSKLEVDTGVGDTTLDFTGQWKQDVNVVVNGGVGQVKIIVPTDTGVRITAEGGLGNVNANGLTVNGKTYTNAAYGTSATTINIDVRTGIGNIDLVQGR